MNKIKTCRIRSLQTFWIKWGWPEIMSLPDAQQADLLGDEPWKSTKVTTNSSNLTRPAKLLNIYQKLFSMVSLCSKSKTCNHLNVTCSRHPFLPWLSFFSLWSFVSRRSFLALKGRKFKILTSQQTKACESNISSEGFIRLWYLPLTMCYPIYMYKKFFHEDIKFMYIHIGY